MGKFLELVTIAFSERNTNRFAHKHKHRQSDFELIMLPQRPLFGNELVLLECNSGPDKRLENYPERVFQVKDKRQTSKFQTT
jgi:hypothetical protein